MISFIVALLLLIAGYFIYGKFIERIAAPDPNRKTPAYTMNDGVDYAPMSTWKIFMIQFLNIAGLGPIFGAIMGAKFGVASYFWIVFGTIFAGAVHDYLSGMLSLQDAGKSLPGIVGKYLGTGTQKVMTAFTVLLMVLVGAVFMSGPAELLAGYTPGWMNEYFWIGVIFLYYFLATLFPISTIIGRVYPLFAIVFIFMAVALLVMLFVKFPAMPEVWNGGLQLSYETNPIFPMMFISIACGAISGFHATQSPLMARCMTNEKHGRPIFYGAMVTEGIVALIWAAVATWFFQENGTLSPQGKPYSAAQIATLVTNDWLGIFGGILAVLGIVAAPITSGDTALRSARLIVADFVHKEQRTVKSRMLICVPLFVATFFVLWYSLSDKNGFAIIWRYFAWSNQTLSIFTLWAITVALMRRRSLYFVTLLPAMFMTCVCTTYLCIAPECFGLPALPSYIVGIAAAVAGLALFMRAKARYGA